MLKSLSLTSLSNFRSVPEICEQISLHATGLSNKIKLNFPPTPSRIRLERLYYDTSKITENYTSINTSYSINAYIKSRSRSIEMLDSRHFSTIETLADLKRETGGSYVDDLLKPQIILSLLLQHAYHITNTRHLTSIFCT